MHWKNHLAASLVALSMSFGASALHAQGIVTGQIAGTIQDPTGAVIPGATITAINKAEGIKFTETSTGSGEFTLTNLPVGLYTITITRAGFGDLKLDNVNVETGKTFGLGVEKLQTGTATESVEVSTGRGLLETTQAQVTTTFDSEQVEDLPTGGGLDQLALLVPGVVGTHSANFSNTNGVGISSNGQRGRSNNFELDGQANNDNSVAGEQIFFQNEDAVQEIQIITNNFSAQYGRNMGSVVNYLTKSGTNSIHGSAFEFYTGDWLSSYTQAQKSTDSYFNNCPSGSNAAFATANFCTLQRLPRFTDNTFGGTLGFPILKDKLFGFGSGLFTRDYNGATSISSGTRYFPTPAGLAALQAAYPNNPGVAELVNFGPYAAKGGVVTNTGTPTTTTVTYNGVTTTIPISQITRTFNPNNTDQEDLGRLDYQLDNKDRFFLRYFYQFAPNRFAGGSFPSGAYYNTGATSHSIGSDWTHTFGPRWVNQVRYSFQQSTFNFDGGGFPNCTIKNLSACPSTFTLSAPFLSLGLANNIPQGRVVKVTQVQDNATWNIGRHSITFGGEFDYQNSPNVFLPYINGGFTVTSYNNLLANVVSTETLATGASANIHFTEPDVAAYIQDDWKVTPALTLNMGLRYEFFGQSLNLLHNSTVASQTGPNPQWNTALPLSTTTFPYISPFKKGFEPRLGFAYNPESLKKLVVRGGFAINFDPAYYNIALNSYSAAPVVNQSSFGCAASLGCIPAGGAYNAAVHAADDKYNPTGGNPGAKTQTQVTPNFHNPYAESYTLGLQYEVLKAATLEVRYSGNHTVGNFQTVNGNPTVGPNASGGLGLGSFNGTALVPALATYFPTIAGPYCTTSALNSGTTATTADLGREHCGNTLVRTRTNTAFSIYNALQTSLQTRNLYGFTGSVAYTYSRTIDNASEVFSDTGNSAFAQNPYDTNVGERGVSAVNFKNVTSVGMVYTLPFFKGGHSLVAKAVGGLQFNSLYTFNSGQAFTPVQNYYSLLAYYYSPNKTTAAGYGNQLFSLCDYNFNATFTGADACHPFIGNPKAPNGNIALNTGNGIYIDQNGNRTNPNNARLIVNNAAEAITRGTPFGNLPRNTFQGNSYNNVNFGAFKSFHVTERYNLQLQTTLFNAFNRAYYGLPDPYIDDAEVQLGNTFNNFSGNSGGSFGPTTGSATGSRNIQLGARLQF